MYGKKMESQFKNKQFKMLFYFIIHFNKIWRNNICTKSFWSWLGAYVGCVVTRGLCILEGR